MADCDVHGSSSERPLIVAYGAVAVGREYDLRKRLSDPNASLDLICKTIRAESSESQTSACPSSEKIPFVLMTG